MTQEQIEQNAEEYQTEKRKAFNEHEQLCWGDVYKDWKNGAEFGYNKANEWHYVKDGDFPKDEKDMLMSEQLILLTKMKGTNNLSISIGQYNFSTQEFSYPHIVGLTEVIAWKEIVLPKESE